MLKTTMTILDDPKGTQETANAAGAELQNKIDHGIAHPTAEVVPRPQDTQPLNPLATKVVVHQEHVTIETAPGVRAVLGSQEPPGSTRVVMHALTAGDQPKGAMGACRMTVLDDPLGRAAAAEAQARPQLTASVAETTKKAPKKAPKKATKKATQ